MLKIVKKQQPVSQLMPTALAPISLLVDTKSSMKTITWSDPKQRLAVVAVVGPKQRLAVVAVVGA